MAWATLINKTRAVQIYASRSAVAVPAHRQSVRATGDVGVTGLSVGQLLPVQDEEFSELGNMDQVPIQHEIPVETTLQNTGAKLARISTAYATSEFSWDSLERIQFCNPERFLVHVGIKRNSQWFSFSVNSGTAFDVKRR